MSKSIIADILGEDRCDTNFTQPELAKELLVYAETAELWEKTP